MSKSAAAGLSIPNDMAFMCFRLQRHLHGREHGLLIRHIIFRTIFKMNSGAPAVTKALDSLSVECDVLFKSNGMNKFGVCINKVSIMAAK